MPTPSSDTATKSYTLGLVGARGSVGRELIALLQRHSAIELTSAWSESNAGQPIEGVPGMSFEAPDLDAWRESAPDIVALALPNGRAAEAVAALESSRRPPALIIDCSADHRFDASWVYGLPETNRSRIRGAGRIANPGCYATAMGLTLSPIRDRLLGVPHCFGVSGYSGAGSTPSERNNVARLTGGVLPYSSVGHIHEREVSCTLGVPIRFAPSVAPFERGIVMTVLFELDAPTDEQALASIYREAYRDEQLIDVIDGATPRVQEIVGRPGAVIGAIQVDPAHPTRGAAVCVIDNLLKGAASQALQNINAALGLHKLEGISP
ncbi:MAG: N-acetyl-gamma-glutamyl-phosphate reductase [Phycisphaeraceae bacterium]|nr:N-acetyl-gamma-glutamyl-phosphate reductase [Phycisphaeraceae bacterium]MCB9848657.1 N-acetyl-gamma-glutamyl-phosphate reductase [Phycisphaeraceae bacterium]